MLLPFFILISCSSSTSVDDSIYEAKVYLSDKKCDLALAALSGITAPKNGRYLQTLASAYACKAGFSEITFFTTDIEKFGNPSPFGGTTLFSTSSSMDAPDNASYVNLQKAIDTLLYAGGISKIDEDPTAAARAALLASDEAKDINAQLMYLILAQLGKYLSYYGNSSDVGYKGGGSETNACLYNYDGTINVTYNLDIDGDNSVDTGTMTLDLLIAALGLTGATGSCDDVGKGHADLNSVARLCQGAVLMNSFLDIFPAVIASMDGDKFDSFSTIDSLITEVKQYVTAPIGFADAFVIYNQTQCEADYEADTEGLEVYFVFLFETLFL